MNKPVPYTWEQYQTEQQADALYAGVWRLGQCRRGRVAVNLSTVWPSMSIPSTVCFSCLTTWPNKVKPVPRYRPKVLIRPTGAMKSTRRCMSCSSRVGRRSTALPLRRLLNGLWDGIVGDEQALDDFSCGFLTSCRRVMVRLQDDDVWAQTLNLAEDCWYQVTEIDGD